MTARHTTLTARLTRTLCLTTLAVLIVAGPADAADVGYFRFEEGADGAGATGAMIFGVDSVVDSAGGDDPFRTFAGFTAPTYSATTPSAFVPQTGAVNDLSTSYDGGDDIFQNLVGPMRTGAYTDFTVEAYVSFSALGGFQTIVGRDDTFGGGGGGQNGAPTSLFYLQKNAADDFRVALTDAGGGEVAVNSTFSPVANRWYHLAAVGDATAGTLTLYVNGASVGSTGGFTGLFNPANDSSWTIGRGAFDLGGGETAVDFVNGFIDEVRFSNTAIAPSQFLNSAATGTLAYWRFEEGSPNAQAPAGTPGFVYDQMTFTDSSGNGNHLEVWDGGGAGYAYRTDVPASPVPQTGAPNTLSIQNTGGFPATFTQSGNLLSTLELREWTVEVSWKPEETNTFRTVVGRDAQGVATSDVALAAFYLGASNTDALRVTFVDEAGFTHVAETAAGFLTGWVFGVDDPADFNWYDIAVTSDGSTLSLYVKEEGVDSAYVLVAQTDLTLSGSTDTRLTDGLNAIGGVAGVAGAWSAGAWTVGRGLYGGGHTDRAYGFIDEVRITSGALSPDQFLFSVPIPTPAALPAGLALIGLVAVRRRRR